MKTSLLYLAVLILAATGRALLGINLVIIPVVIYAMVKETSEAGGIYFFAFTAGLISGLVSPYLLGADCLYYLLIAFIILLFRKRYSAVVIPALLFTVFFEVVYAQISGRFI